MVYFDNSDTVTLHTSGSTGTPKEITVEKTRLRASAEATCRFLGLRAGQRALLCLSTDYIAGLMMVVRADVAHLELISQKPSSHPFANEGRIIHFTALTPMQVYSTLSVPREAERLKRVKKLIIGGGAISPELERKLRRFPNAVYSTYGMTETLSHIALRRISGRNASKYYKPMEGVSLSLTDDSRLVIDAPRIANTKLTTNDIVSFRHGSNEFKILGRADFAINSGGIKVHPEQVEMAVSKYIKYPFAIVGTSDEKFGQVVTMVIDATADQMPDSALNEIFTTTLQPYHKPRRIVRHSIPTTSNGKIARRQLIDEINSL